MSHFAATDSGNQPPRLTVPRFLARKGQNPPLVLLTAYDFLTARLFDQVPTIDALLVGDSLATVIQGEATTLTVTMDQMVYHTRLVSRGVRRALVVADMPFLSYQVDLSQAVLNAGRLLQEGGAQAVKLEGGQRCAAAIQAITQAQIPVMAHLGLTPQSFHTFGGYKVQRAREQLLVDAQAVQEAGAFAVVLEGIPSAIAQAITQQLQIPTIGIGAGPHCDGQILVWADAAGLIEGPHPKFVKQFDHLASRLRQVAEQFAHEVHAGTFPGPEHSYQ